MKNNLFRNYVVFLKYIFSSGISFVLDLGLFRLFSYFFKSYISSFLLLSTILARIISSFVNYLLNRNQVFSNNSSHTKFDRTTFLKYYLLVIVQMFVSGFLVTYLYDFVSCDELFLKIPVEIGLFFVNYFVQKKFIFCKGDSYEEKN